MSTRSPAISRVMAASGRGLAAVFFIVGRVRRGRGKALHPRGSVLAGRLVRHGGFGTGVPWVDNAGGDSAIVRLSRSAGLPAPLPDVLGLALRLPLSGDRHADVLLSTTGRRGVGRFLLRPALRPRQSFYSTLLPYRAPSGPLLIGAQPSADGSGGFQLVWSRPTGAWRVFATLSLAELPETAADGELSFDPVLHEVPGLTNYEWVRRLRQPSYAAARRARDSV